MGVVWRVGGWVGGRVGGWEGKVAAWREAGWEGGEVRWVGEVA